MPLAISITPISELQPGSTRWVLPVTQSDNTHANCPQASTKNSTPALKPMYNGASEKEKISHRKQAAPFFRANISICLQYVPVHDTAG